MSSSEEFNDKSFVKSLPIRKGLEESPRFAIPKQILLQLSEMIAEKKIKNSKLKNDLPPKLASRIPFDLMEDLTEKKDGVMPKETKETVYVDSQGGRTRCVGEECVAETEIRDPLSRFSEAAPYSLVGERTVSKDVLYKEQLSRRVTDLNLKAISKLQSFITELIPNIIEQNPEKSDRELKNIIRQKTIEEAKKLGKEYPLTETAVDQVIESASEFMNNYAKRTMSKIGLSESPTRDSPVMLS